MTTLLLHWKSYSYSTQGVRTIPRIDLKIYLRPHVNFDLPTTKVDRFMPLSRWPLVPICIKIRLS